MKTLTTKEKIDGCEKGINQDCSDLVCPDLSTGTSNLRATHKCTDRRPPHLQILLTSKNSLELFDPRMKTGLQLRWLPPPKAAVVWLHQREAASSSTATAGPPFQTRRLPHQLKSFFSGQELCLVSLWHEENPNVSKVVLEIFPKICSRWFY